ncbi:DUF4097 family beta strand repeat-containing protein [Streptomyces sp. NPDC005485]|uniref:DUF4097 family beta strand repeat-containing protein n=1 Tax=Streptomyces sp. NPDC005485 TaxID=3155591 RepID=UPI0033A06681
MDTRSVTRAWALAAALAALPLAGACGGADHGGNGSNGSNGDGLRAAGAEPAPSRGTRLVITTDNGVRLRPADGDRVVADRHIRTHWSHQDRTWVLDLSCRTDDKGKSDGDGDGRPCPRMPEVDIPAGTSVSVSARNAGIDVAGVSAALELATVNGDVTVTRSGDGARAARLTTRNGSIRADTLRSAGLHAETVNGDVVLGCATSPDRVTAATTNGSVRVTVPHDSPAYRVRATTDNGRASTDVRTSEAVHRTMTLSTVNGDVTAIRE